MNYKDYNDEELLMYVKEESEDANSILYEKYRPLVISMAKKNYYPKYNVGIELSDLIQEGFLGLNTAIHYYNDKTDSSFSTFARKCIERRIFSLIARQNRKKYKALNESLSLNFCFDDKETFLLNDLVQSKEEDPLTKITLFETKEDLLNFSKNILTDLEYKVLNLKIEGLNYNQIAFELGKDKKSIQNAMERTRRKIKKKYRTI